MINIVNFRVVNFYLLNVLVDRVFSHFFFLPSKKEKEKYFQLGDAVFRPYDIRAPIKHGKKIFFSMLIQLVEQVYLQFFHLFTIFALVCLYVVYLDSIV